MFATGLRAAHFSKLVGYALLGCVMLSGPALALDVVWIEEHWELQVGGADAGRSAPQVTMVMSPNGSVSGDFFLVTMNHWSYPNFAPGGIQLQRWNGENCVATSNASSSSTLALESETITWRQRISLIEDQLRFELLDGNSQSWGSFGGWGTLRLSSPTSLQRLNDYRPAISLEQSGIAYAGNRVSSLTLQKLRWKTSDGEIHELIAPIDIAADIDP